MARHFPQFEILECLGRGGMGVVYKARQPKLNRIVALKILAPEKVADARFAERFQREAQMLARLNHPNIVTVYDFGEADGLYYLMMEFVDGVSLRQLLQARKIAPEEALGIVPEICEALQFAHDQGVVHRDIKPENVLLDKQGRVKIADFGIAKIVTGDQAQQAITQDQVLGTPHYMAPEQVEKPQTVDHRADIYSLGVVFYEMLTGELPLGKFRSPSRMVQVDVRLDEVVLHTLEKEPERRYQHASEVKSDVETIASTRGRPAASGKPPTPVHVKRWRDLWLWDTEYLALFVIVPAVVAGILVLFFWPHWGSKALWLFAIELGGIGLAANYAWVFRRIQRLKAALPQPTGEVAECLMFWRPFQSPGLAVLHEDRLELIPIIRSPVTVPLEGIVAVSEVRWFNGIRLWSKKGFVLELTNGRRVGLAVAESFARRWRARLSRGTLPETGVPPAMSGRVKGVLLALAIGAVLICQPAIKTLIHHWKQAGASPSSTVAAPDKTGSKPGAGAVEADLILAKQPPVVVETFPVSGTRDVAPGETEIRVRFSKPMADGSWSWCYAWENSLPEFIGQPRYDADGRTCVVRARLEASRTYGCWLNTEEFQNFADQDRTPAIPYLLIFQTTEISNPLPRAARWQEDLEYLEAELPKRHLDFFKLISRDDFHQGVTGLKERVANSSDAEIVLGVMRIVASPRVAHTQLGWSAYASAFHKYPMAMKWFSDGLAVLAASRKYREALGARVLKIGPLTPEQLEQLLGAYISHENQPWLRHQSPAYMIVAEWLQHLKVADADGSVEFLLAKDGGQPFTLRVHPVAGSAANQDTVTAADALNIPAPLYRRQRGAFYWREFLPQSKTLYIQYNKCADAPNEPFSEFAANALRFAATNSVSRVVVDLRANTGGHSEVILPLLEGLRDNPQLSAKGRLYVLIGGQTFSSGLFNAIYFQRRLHAILVGEPTGGRPNSYGEVRALKLPHSHLDVYYPVKRFQRISDGDPDSLEPDITVPFTLKDFLAGHDPVLEAALNHSMQ
jgi:tRNA A-37 threonylcarbamoyl transferase component Bud32